MSWRRQVARQREEKWPPSALGNCWPGEATTAHMPGGEPKARATTPTRQHPRVRRRTPRLITPQLRLGLSMSPARQRALVDDRHGLPSRDQHGLSGDVDDEAVLHDVTARIATSHAARSRQRSAIPRHGASPPRALPAEVFWGAHGGPSECEAWATHSPRTPPKSCESLGPLQRPSMSSNQVRNSEAATSRHMV